MLDFLFSIDFHNYSLCLITLASFKLNFYNVVFFVTFYKFTEFLLMFNAKWKLFDFWFYSFLIY